ILSMTPSAKAMEVGSKIAGAGAGKGLATRVGYGALGGAAEGAVFGAGQGISELALSNEPLSAERVVSVLGSNALLGAAMGGGIGGGLPIAGAIGGAAWKGTKAVAGKGIDLASDAAKKLGASLDDYPTVKRLLGGTTEEAQAELATFQGSLAK